MPNLSAQPQSRPAIPLALRIGLPLLAVVARLAFGWPHLAEVPADPDNYIAFAQSLRNGEGFVYEGRPTAYRPPLFPITIVPLVSAFGEGRSFHTGLLIVHAVLGGWTCLLAMRAASALMPPNVDDRQAAWLPALAAGLGTALDPVLLSQAPLVMTETLAAFLLTGAVEAVLRGRSVSAGVWFGLASLCRPSLLACLAMTAAARIVAFSTDPWPRRIREATLMTACTLAVLAPWAARNRVRLGEAVWTTTHGGYTLALANNAVYYDEVLGGPPGSVWTGPRQQAWMDTIGTDTIGLPEPEADRRMKRKAIGFIRSRPLSFIHACVDRQLRFWAPAPSAAVYGRGIRLASMVWTVPFWVLAAAGVVAGGCRRWPNACLAVVPSGLAAVHLVYWTDLRMRAPIVPTLAILAAVGANSILRACERRT